MKFRIKDPHSQRSAAEPKRGRDCHSRTAHSAQKHSQQESSVACVHAETELMEIFSCSPSSRLDRRRDVLDRNLRVAQKLSFVHTDELAARLQWPAGHEHPLDVVRLAVED